MINHRLHVRITRHRVVYRHKGIFISDNTPQFCIICKVKPAYPFSIFTRRKNDRTRIAFYNRFKNFSVRMTGRDDVNTGHLFGYFSIFTIAVWINTGVWQSNHNIYPVIVSEVINACLDKRIIMVKCYGRGNGSVLIGNFPHQSYKADFKAIILFDDFFVYYSAGWHQIFDTVVASFQFPVRYGIARYNRDVESVCQAGTQKHIETARWPVKFMVAQRDGVISHEG